MAEPTVGCIVDYHLDDGDIRPAIVVRVSPHGVDLRVFTSLLDQLEAAFGAIEVQEGTSPAHWSWPEKQELGQHTQGSHYESLPHSDCPDPHRCDCTCRGCLRDKDPELLRLLEDRGYVVDGRGVLWHREAWLERGEGR